MTILSILPLLIFILGLLVISKVNVFFSKRTNSVVIVYVFILLTATVVYSLLPMEKQAETNEVEKEFWRGMEDFKEIIQEGSLEQLKKNYTYQEWILTTTKKELFLERPDTPTLLTKVVNEQTNQIKVYLFHTDMLFNGKIISGKLGNFTAVIDDNYLHVYPHMEETIRTSVFMEEFPIKQFSDYGYGDGFGYTIDGGYLGLYIVAPTDVKISE